MNTLLLADMMASVRNAAANLKGKVDEYIMNNAPEVAAKLVGAAVIFFVGKWLAKILERGLRHGLKQAKVDETLSKFLCRIAHTLMICGVVVASVSKLGVETNTFAAAIAAAGLAIGLALQGSLSNFAAGIMIILFRPFKVGDVIEAAGTLGVVDEIHIFHTLLHTPDNIDIVIPNGSITNGNISNLSSQPVRRVDMVFGCGYNDDLLAVKRLLEQIVSRDERVLRDPAPKIAVSELGDHCVNFVVRPWVRTTDYWNVKYSIIEAVKMEFDAHGFSIPYPQRDVHVHQVAAMEKISTDDEPLPEPAVTEPVSAEFTEQGLLRPRRAA